ncbi:epigen [Hyperolius riggenbachi]|uniref:epigen n=1 Tax=Hyperolius riggenbachi TaxID=752182 RepID=UPI0035A289AE
MTSLRLLSLVTCALMTVYGEEPSATKIPATNSTKSLTKGIGSDFACPGEYSNYCFNGQCVFHTSLEIPFCRCSSGFTGDRCAHVVLPVHQPQTEATYIAIGILVGLLISGLLAMLWCYKEKRCQKSARNYGVFNREETL